MTNPNAGPNDNVLIYHPEVFASVRRANAGSGGANVTVVYHDDCHDGVTAAWAAKRAYPNALLYSASYGRSVNFASFAGRDVVLVDFCWPLPVMQQLMRGEHQAASVTVLDHHVSALKSVLLPLVAEHVEASNNAQARCPMCVVCDVNRSGAGITWDMFFFDEPRPHMINWVEDRDLWKFALPASRSFHAFSETLPLTIYAREDLFNQTQDPDQVKQVLDAGRAIERANALLVQDIVHYAEVYAVRLPSLINPTQSEFYHVPVAVVPTKRLVSEVGSLLATGYYFAITIVDVRPMFGTFGGDHEEVYVSFRSANRSDAADVSRIAAGLGGGGHKNAAGARMTSEELARRVHRTGRRVFPA